MGIGGPAIKNTNNLDYTPMPNNETPQTPPSWDGPKQSAFQNTPIEISKIDIDHAKNIANGNKELTIPSHLKPED